MNLKRAISAIAAMAISASCVAGLVITSSAAATPTVYVNEDFQSSTFTADKDLSEGTNDNSLHQFGDISYQIGNRNGASQGTAKIKVSGEAKELEILQTKFSGSSRGTKLTFTPATDGVTIPKMSELDNEAILRLSFDIKANSNAQFTVIGVGTMTHSALGWSSDEFSTVVIDLNKFTGKQTITVDGTKKSEESLTATTITGLDFQLASVDGTNNTYPHLDNIKLEQVQADTTVQTAEYTVKWVDGNGANIKEPVSISGTIGDAITLMPADKQEFKVTTGEGTEAVTKKYIYVSDDSEGKTISGTETTVVTITFREAAKVNYTVNSNLGTEIGTGTGFEGDNATVPYPRYILKDNVAYIKDAINNQYNYTFTIGATSPQTATLDYTKSTQDGATAVFYGEGETIFTKNNVGNAGIRCSMGEGGDVSEKTIVTTLPAGKYKVTIGLWGGHNTEDSRNATYTFTAGEAKILESSTTGSHVKATEEFTLNAETAIEVEKTKAADNGDRTCIDYVLIEKIIPNVIDDAGTSVTTGTLTAAQIEMLESVGESSVAHGLTADTEITVYTVKVVNYDGTSMPTLVIPAGEGKADIELTPAAGTTYGYQDGSNYVFVLQTAGYARAKSVKIGDSTLNFTTSD